jgi:uncharacterized protein YbbC (DUF1343 family)
MLCTGARIIVTDRLTFRPFLTGIAIVQQIRKDYRDRFEWKADHFDRLCGTSRIREMIDAGTPLHVIKSAWTDELHAYDVMRKAYLLYR